MDEKNKEIPKMTKEDVARSKRLIKQSEDKLNLMISEKEAKEKLVAIKEKYNKVIADSAKPEFLYRQEFYDTLLDIDKINMKHYVTNVNDAIDREESSIKALQEAIDNAEVSDNEWW